jgi:hypothetical protein
LTASFDPLEAVASGAARSPTLFAAALPTRGDPARDVLAEGFTAAGASFASIVEPESDDGTPAAAGAP